MKWLKGWFVRKLAKLRKQRDAPSSVSEHTKKLKCK